MKHVYKQKDGVTLGSSLGPNLANAFRFLYKKKNGLKNVLLNLSQFL